MSLSEQLSPELAAAFDRLPAPTRAAVLAHAGWVASAHPYQIPPPLDQEYLVWMLLAGRGAGKTRSAAEALWWWCWQEPNSRGLVLAPTSNDLKFTCFEGVSGLLGCIPQECIADYNKQDHVIKLTNGSSIRGISADSYERLRGPQFHYAWCDELAAFVYAQDAWDMMMFGLRLGDSPRVIVTTTPRPKDLILDLVGREGADVVIDRASTYDNADNLAPTFRKQLEQYRGSKLYQQEVLGELVDLEEGKVVSRDMFKLWPAGKAFPRFEFILQSYDCAFSEKTYNDPTAMTTWGVFKPDDGPMSVLLIDCWAEHLDFPRLKPKVLDEWRVSYGEGKDAKRPDLILVEDKAAGISLIQELRHAHLPVIPWNPGKADKMQRLQITASIFATGRVWLPESSVRKGYVKDWAEGFLSQLCAFPDATHDDYVDSCLIGTTLVTMADGSNQQLCDVRVGQYVMTPKGPRMVTAVHDNGAKEVWEVVSGDQSIIGTPNHLVFTSNGWKRIDSLVVSTDTVCLYQGETSWRSNLQALLSSRLYSMVTSTTDTLRAITRRTADTLRGLVTGFIAMFGCTITGQSLRACTFTTSTATRPTTTSATWPASQEGSTGTNTEPRRLSAAGDRSNLSISPGYAVVPPLGISHQRVLRGIESMPRHPWLRLGTSRGTTRTLTKFATGVARSLLHTLSKPSFARKAAKQPSQSTVSVRQVMNTHTTRHVYDLTVEGEHCYYANGILVHNCTQAIRYLKDAGWLEINPEPRYDDAEDYVDAAPKRVNPYSA